MLLYHIRRIFSTGSNDNYAAIMHIMQYLCTFVSGMFFLFIV